MSTSDPSEEKRHTHRDRTQKKGERGMEETVPSERVGGDPDATVPSQPIGEDANATVPSQPVGEDANATVPSQPVGGDANATVPSQPVGEDANATVPSQPVGGDENATVPSQPVGGDESATVPSQPVDPDPGESREPTASTPPSGGDRPEPAPPAPRVSAASSADALLGKELGGCQLDSLLGRGAMGAVYRARQLRLNREVAVKVMRPDLLADSRMLQRFESEARTVAQFQSPHVVMVHDVGEEQGVHFLVMELVRGKNLREYTKLLAGGRLPVSEALPLLRQACAGLEEARRQGIIHRDIKPDNLMLTERGELKVADFGIAKPQNDDLGLTMTQELVGTPLYMSPEQCQGVQDIDFRSDMYSLGATFYYLLTGEPPVQATSVYELLKTKTQIDCLALWEALPELDEDHPLSRVIARMTALEREDRYDSYEELSSDLLLVQQGRTMEIRLPPSRQAGAKGGGKAASKGKGGLIAVLGVVLLAALGGGYFYWQQQEQRIVSEVPDDPKPTPPVPAATSVLAGLRQRLRDEGPTDQLRLEVLDVTAGGDDASTREALATAVAQGLRVQERCEAVKIPQQISPPFAGLEKLRDKVDQAHELPPDADVDIRSWAEGQRKQMLLRLAKAAGNGLETAWEEWREKRRQAGEKVAEYEDLKRELKDLREARSTALGLMPSQADAITLSEEAFDNAEQGLEVAPPQVDVAALLARLRSRLDAEGPLESIKADLQSLKQCDEAEEVERKKLLDAFGKAERLASAANTLPARRPLAPQLPFDEVEAFLISVDKVLNPDSKAVEQLPEWVRNRRDKLRDEEKTREAVLGVAQTEWRAYEERAKGKFDPKQLGARLAELQEGFERAQRMFEELRDPLRQLTGERGFAEASAAIDKRRKQLKLAQSVSAIREEVAALTTLADFRAQGDTLRTKLKRLSGELDNGLSTSDVVESLQRAKDTLEQWQSGAAAVRALAAAIAQGDLSGALRKAGSSTRNDKAQAEFEVLAGVSRECRDAFAKLIENLDCDETVRQLGSQAQALEGLGSEASDALRQVESWRKAVAQLRVDAAGMVKIEAGNTKIGRCDAFFLAPTEATVRRYEEFRAAAAKLDQEQLKELLGDAMPPEGELDGVLGVKKGAFETLPVEGISHYAAAACAAWFGRSLPTRQEWAIAAFGDQHEHEFPWGGKIYRTLQRSLEGADVGGPSWRPGGVPRHLGGNVAEWLACEPGAKKAGLAGGSYLDVPRDMRRRAKGELVEEARGKALRGYGFRMALRPKTRLAPLFKSGQFPDLSR